LKQQRLLPLLLSLALLAGCEYLPIPDDLLPSPSPVQESPAPTAFPLEDLPPYAGSPWVELAGEPAFSQEEREADPFTTFSPLDDLGRPGPATAKLSVEGMPTEERGPIGQVKPAGWHTVRYDWIDGKYLYNRCHLLAFQLTGENANPLNLITGTRYLNVEGMLPIENQVAAYLRDTGDQVLYRVTPIYDGAALVCSGVEVEVQSVAEGGLTLHRYLYNVQPGVVIDYLTGESWADPEATPVPTATPEPTPSPTEAPAPALDPQVTYILNTRSGRFHTPDCPGAATMSEKNRRETSEDRETLLAQGYVPCGTCKP